MLNGTTGFGRMAAAIFFGGLLALAVSGQAKPFSLKHILNAISSINEASGEQKSVLYSKLVKDIGTKRVDFPLTVEKEQDLRNEGATDQLIAVIRANSPAIPRPAPTPAPTPVPTPTPPDHSFFLARAEVSFGKGMFGEALADYDKAIELKVDNAAAFLSRGKTHFNLDSFDKAVADFDKAIEIDPKQSLAFYVRGLAYEKKGNREKAIADYQQAVDLDAGNEAAKTSLKKLQDELAKTMAPPESIPLGNLTPHAIHLQPPSYPDIARRANIRGAVTVEVKLDENGNVVSAKAVSGHHSLRRAAEDAALRSKFKPAKYREQAVKATGTITYIF